MAEVNNEVKYILKRNWKSKSGYSEILYLGYNEQNHLDCVPDKEKAIKMSKEDCKGWISVLYGHSIWTIEEIVNEEEKEETRESEVYVEDESVTFKEG